MELKEKVKKLIEENRLSEFLLRHGFYALKSRSFWKALVELYDELPPLSREIIYKMFLLSPKARFKEVEEFFLLSLEKDGKEAVPCCSFIPSERIAKKLVDLDPVTLAGGEILHLVSAKVRKEIALSLLEKIQNSELDPKEKVTIANGITPVLQTADESTKLKAVSATLDFAQNSPVLGGLILRELIPVLQTIKDQEVRKKVKTVLTKLIELASKSKNFNLRKFALTIVAEFKEKIRELSSEHQEKLYKAYLRFLKEFSQKEWISREETFLKSLPVLTPLAAEHESLDRSEVLKATFNVVTKALPSAPGLTRHVHLRKTTSRDEATASLIRLCSQEFSREFIEMAINECNSSPAQIISNRVHSPYIRLRPTLKILTQYDREGRILSFLKEKLQDENYLVRKQALFTIANCTPELKNYNLKATEEIIKTLTKRSLVDYDASLALSEMTKDEELLKKVSVSFSKEFLKNPPTP
ncbi:MAG: hypothetical protein GXO39_06435, partial [Thermotogae bacterium]|nr:hypothetical protein [Thermotogota bacterium]